MRLQDDEPDALIMSCTQHVELIREFDHLLKLELRTDLSSYSPRDRDDYCLHLQINQDDYRYNINQYLRKDMSSGDPNELLRYLTADGTPTIGLVGIDVQFDWTTLKFARLDRADIEKDQIWYYLDNRKEFSYCVAQPLEGPSFFDPRFGEYDTIHITNQTHSERTTNVAINYQLNDTTVYSAVAHLFADDQASEAFRNEYRLVDVTHFAYRAYA